MLLANVDLIFDQAETCELNREASPSLFCCVSGCQVAAKLEKLLVEADIAEWDHSGFE